MVIRPLTEAEAIIAVLANHPERFNNVYNKLVELYGACYEYGMQTLSPSGSLQSFNDRKESLKSQIDRLKSEILVQL
jgi:hypothetical protein